MKQRIKDMIAWLTHEDGYDREQAHIEYDKIMQDFIEQGHSKEDYPEIIELIKTEKTFWYV